MYIKRFIIIFSIFSIISTSAMLNPIKTRATTYVINKINQQKKMTSLQKRFYLRKNRYLRKTENDIFNKNPSELEIAFSVPAGMVGSLVSGFVGAGVIGVPTAFVTGMLAQGDEQHLNSTIAVVGGASGVIGGIVTAGSIGGVPGAVAWSTVCAGCLALGIIIP